MKVLTPLASVSDALPCPTLRCSPEVVAGGSRTGPSARVWCAVAKGLDKHQERIAAINLCGKDLARRADKKCELCAGNDELRPHDTDADAEPSLDTLLLACKRCRDFADGGKCDERELRFLETAVWHELPHVAALAKSMLSRVDADWARATLDML